MFALQKETIFLSKSSKGEGQMSSFATFKMMATDGLEMINLS